MATTLPDNNRMKLSGRSHRRAVAGEMVVGTVGQRLDGPATYPIGVRQHELRLPGRGTIGFLLESSQHLRSVPRSRQSHTSPTRGRPIMLFQKMTNGRTRQRDSWGRGHYGAPRGSRTHRGLDIVSVPGEVVSSPIPGHVVREAVPYANDPSLRGVVIKGSGEWNGFEVKVFYVEGLFSGFVRAGDPLGHAQDITQKYPGITNHIHVEVRVDGEEVSPLDYFGMSF
jgi:hypothetical protein